MPLDKSGSRASIGKNIKTEEGAGRQKKQAIAIALNTAREAGAEIPKKKRKSAAHTLYPNHT
jgi:predicted RNase H-like HicB family nuclease